MPTWVRAVIGLLTCYAAGAFIGVMLISVLSGNSHDKSIEMAMTSAFVTGPIGALIGCIVGLLWRRR